MAALSSFAQVVTTGAVFLCADFFVALSYRWLPAGRATQMKLSVCRVNSSVKSKAMCDFCTSITDDYKKIDHQFCLWQPCSIMKNDNLNYFQLDEYVLYFVRLSLLSFFPTVDNRLKP